MESIITADLSKFGYLELEKAGKLLTLYAEYGVTFLGGGLSINCNLNSGYVFLCDEDFNVGILNDTESRIVQFFTCFECSYEGTQEEALDEGKDFLSNEGHCSKVCALENA